MTPQQPKSSKQPAAGANSLASLPPELARQNFKTLLAANPNFFGNLAESTFSSVVVIQGDTAYESIGCVGYNPQLEQLRATINIKQTSGYSGPICTAGSQEYVRFYLSYDGGTTWQDQGLRSVNVFDVPGPKPLEFAVTLPISPVENFCFFQNLPLVRAILSWNFAPPAATPGFVPVWGDIVEAQIQIEGFEFIILETLLADAKVKLPEEIAQAVNLNQKVSAAPEKALSPAELYKLYAGTPVPQHRYLASLLSAAANAATLTTATELGGISGVDIASAVASFINTSGDTAYEQLDCIGLDPNLSQLTGVLEIKQSSGYAGGPCTAGSTEYVAFWVDWGTGLEYAGTTSVGVHDFSSIPAGGLQYNVFLPVNLLAHAKPCSSGPQTAKVHAVLSWNIPPSTTNPYAPVVWGNSLDGLILIPPGQQIGPGQQVPVLSAVGDVATEYIGSDGRITSATTVTTGVYYADAPFGGRITLAGQISNPTSGLKYRIMKAPHGSSSFAPVVNEPAGLTLNISTFSGGSWTESTQTFHADADGYYPYQDFGNQSVQDHLLGLWYSTPADTGFAYDLRVDLYTGGPDIESNVVTVLINNAAPGATLTPSFGECGQVAPGDTISGTFSATATDFGSFSFEILPPGPAHGVLPVPPSKTSIELGGTVADPGVTSGSFSIDTTGMDPCGYSLTLNVWDRTNVDSGLTSNYNPASAGFCLQTGS